MITLCRSDPFDSCHALMSSSPVSSPAAPAAGWRVAACMPVISQSTSSVSTNRRSQPWMSGGGAAGWTSANPGWPATVSQNFGLYFIVHDPSG